MDTETREAFARIDHWFELGQAQSNELRQEVGGLRGEVGGLRGEVGELRDEVGELHGEVGELHGEVSGLRGEVGGLRGEVGGLAQRMDRIERELAGLRQDFHRFRDWVTARFADVGQALENLARRLERLEGKQDPFG
jgi:predicted nuclease with TOPRIM domain